VLAFEIKKCSFFCWEVWSERKVRKWWQRTPSSVYFSVSETDNSCKVCCRDLSGRCAPYVDAEQKNLFLRKGKPCTVGFCDMNVSYLFTYSLFGDLKTLSCHSAWMDLCCCRESESDLGNEADLVFPTHSAPALESPQVIFSLSQFYNLEKQEIRTHHCLKPANFIIKSPVQVFPISELRDPCHGESELQWPEAYCQFLLNNPHTCFKIQ
jgi:hypothetical protein